MNSVLRLREEARRKARELQIREGQRVQRMNTRRAGSRERNCERCGVDEDEAEAADRNGDSGDALGAQRHETKLVPS